MTDSSSIPVVPAPGVGATRQLWSDRHAGTIVRVSKSGKALWWVRDIAVVVSGSEFDGSAEYDYRPDPAGAELKFTLRRNGRWVIEGAGMNDRGSGLGIGSRREYRDPSF